MENPKATSTPETTGRYTKEERGHFNETLGPDAAVALESLRRQTGICLKVTRHKEIPDLLDASGSTIGLPDETSLRG